jgi:DNA-binding IclR family transcriptional regulator
VVAQIRASGTASSIGEVEEGVAAVATAIRARGGLVGALAIASTTSRLPLERQEQLRGQLIGAASQIGQLLEG